jgi:GTPase SAR1 family protein
MFIYLIFQNSFQQAKSWIKETMENATNPVQIIMVGNKLDLANNGRRSDSEEVRD